MKDSKEVSILLVEDDEVDQMAIKRAFEKLKIANSLEIARDGFEALERLKSINGGTFQRPFLIILDLNLPKMNGIDFLKEIRANENLMNSVVFVLTTSKDEADISETYKLNVAGYIVKERMGERFINAVEMMEHYWRIVELPN